MIPARTLPLLAALLSAPAGAAGVDWYAADAEAAAALAEALEVHWPGHPVEVIAGDPAPWSEGVHHDAAGLLYVRGGEVFRRAEGGELAAQVALVRSWSRDIRVEDSGWLPPLDAPLPEAPPPGPPVEATPAAVTEAPPPAVFDDPVEAEAPAGRSVAVGLGVRDSLDEPGWVEGPRVLARLHGERLGGEVAAYFATAALLRTSETQALLQQLAVDQEVSVDQRRDTFSLSASVDWGAARPGEAGLAVGPFIAAGAELRRWVLSRQEATPDGAAVVLEPGQRGWTPGALGVLGVEAWWAGRRPPRGQRRGLQERV